MSVVNNIVKYAKLFEGIKERGNNQGWEGVFFHELNMSFQELMETVGWKEYHAWCAYFAELVWKLGYSKIDSTYIDKLDKLFSANAVRTFQNFRDRSDFNTSKKPSTGSVAIWQYYKDGKLNKSDIWIRGHAAIVTDCTDDVFSTIEGNISAENSRDGQEVAARSYILKGQTKNKEWIENTKYTGRSLLGFIHPKLI